MGEACKHSSTQIHKSIQGKVFGGMNLRFLSHKHGFRRGS
ncbi:hypothetical protein RISK_000023 [Rhodopirellula islandica]|uniref:Uncharacterized protein n=1 Tax=Rhodopirellula islandica TaxID=595434 RepID=A0A0J1EQT8_RHOIS|nr:hypothetical protein RISK_000023 [Rhodopirellula islandica]